MTIEKLSIEYDAINSENTFSAGDIILGRIVVQVSKEAQISSLRFRSKGKAKVRWHEHYGQNVHVVIFSDELYYDIQQDILRKARDGSGTVGPGRHVFPFSFKIPERNMPSSFKADKGKVVYQLRAELKQSMKLAKTTKTKFTFVSKTDVDIPRLMEPQYGCKDKSVTFFASGNLSLDLYTEKMGYQQGEALKVTAEINNRSTRSVKPKFLLYVKKSFLAQGRRRVDTHDIVKEKGEAVASCSKQTVTKVISIPRELPPSILNCSIIKLEYRLKVVLDVTLNKNPEVKLPIVVLPYKEKEGRKRSTISWEEKAF